MTTRAEIEAQGWSLNPGRHVGVAPGEDVSDQDFKEQLEVLNEELEVLNAQARELEAIIAGNVAEMLEARMLGIDPTAWNRSLLADLCLSIIDGKHEHRQKARCQTRLTAWLITGST